MQDRDTVVCSTRFGIEQYVSNRTPQSFAGFGTGGSRYTRQAVPEKMLAFCFSDSPITPMTRKLVSTCGWLQSFTVSLQLRTLLGGDALEGVPESAVAHALLIHRKVALEHAWTTISARARVCVRE